MDHAPLRSFPRGRDPSQGLLQVQRPFRGWRGPLRSTLLLLVLWAVTPLPALELRGRSVFVRPPSDVELITDSSDVWSPGGEYSITIDIPAAAGAALARLTVQQISGVDWQFPFFVDQTRAFRGRPREAGESVPVQASFENSTRRFTLEFRKPVEPGTTLTVVLKPWHNPSQADIYQFEVVAYPDGENPQASPVGVVNLRIYDRIY